MLKAAAVAFTPTAIITLLGEQKIDGFVDRRIVGADARSQQAPDAKPCAIGETDAPIALPAAVISLQLAQELFATGEGPRAFPLPGNAKFALKTPFERRQPLHRRGRQFG